MEKNEDTKKTEKNGIVNPNGTTEREETSFDNRILIHLQLITVFISFISLFIAVISGSCDIFEHFGDNAPGAWAIFIIFVFLVMISAWIFYLITKEIGKHYKL